MKHRSGNYSEIYGNSRQECHQPAQQEEHKYKQSPSWSPWELVPEFLMNPTWEDRQEMDSQILPRVRRSLVKVVGRSQWKGWSSKFNLGYVLHEHSPLCSSTIYDLVSEASLKALSTIPRNESHSCQHRGTAEWNISLQKLYRVCVWWYLHVNLLRSSLAFISHRLSSDILSVNPKFVTQKPSREIFT